MLLASFLTGRYRVGRRGHGLDIAIVAALDIFEHVASAAGSSRMQELGKGESRLCLPLFCVIPIIAPDLFLTIGCSQASSAICIIVCRGSHTF